jgi:ParB-like chromosome segregation protein Spo0J
MAASIQEFGFKIPVLARSSGEVVDGHLRLKAARELGIREIPTILCDEWTDAQVKAIPAAVRLRAAECVFDRAFKGIELEDIEARVSELERAVETSKAGRGATRRFGSNPTAGTP